MSNELDICSGFVWLFVLLGWKALRFGRNCRNCVILVLETGLLSRLWELWLAGCESYAFFGGFDVFSCLVDFDGLGDDGELADESASWPWTAPESRHLALVKAAMLAAGLSSKEWRSALFWLFINFGFSLWVSFTFIKLVVNLGRNWSAMADGPRDAFASSPFSRSLIGSNPSIASTLQLILGPGDDSWSSSSSLITSFLQES